MELCYITFSRLFIVTVAEALWKH